MRHLKPFLDRPDTLSLSGSQCRSPTLLQARACRSNCPPPEAPNSRLRVASCAISAMAFSGFDGISRKKPCWPPRATHRPESASAPNFLSVLSKRRIRTQDVVSRAQVGHSQGKNRGHARSRRHRTFTLLQRCQPLFKSSDSGVRVS